MFILTESISLNDTINFAKKVYLNEKELSVERIESGILLPSKRSSLPGTWWLGGVLTSTKEYVDISSQIAEGMSNRVLGAYSFHDRDVLHSEERVVYVNCFFGKHWGHFLLDMIGRLWYPAFIDRKCKVAYTCIVGIIKGR